MKTRAIVVALPLLFLLVSALLVFGGPSTSVPRGFSLDDRNYFQERPKITRHEGKYFIEWIYGKYGFYFFPDLKSADDKAVFSLSVTTSTGDRSGKRGSAEIKSKEAIAFVEKGEVYWREPEGKLVRLKVEDSSAKAK